MLPEWLDFAYSENVAVSMFRGLEGNTASWGELVANAQATLGFYQDDLDQQSILRLYDEQHALPLIAASRIFDTASQYSEGIDGPARLNLCLIAAVAYAMYGNFPSAAAVISRIHEEFPDFYLYEEQYAPLIATIAPKYLGTILRVFNGSAETRRYLESLEIFLVEGDASLSKNIREEFINCILNAATTFLGSLLRSARVSLEHIFNLSVSRTLKEYSSRLPNGYVDRLSYKNVRLLLPPQFKAITKHDLINQPYNTLISLPTSTGKTLLGEFCLTSSLTEPGIACYLAPYVALGRQVMKSFETHIPDTIRKHLMVGGFRAPAQLDPEKNRELIVATPERLDALLRLNPDLAKHIKCIVCDEAHLLQSGTRGVKLEGLLTRLRLLQEQQYGFRIVLLSAVLSEYSKLQAWMKIPSSLIITDTWKPTARRLAFWKQDGQLVWHIGDEAVRQPGAKNDTVIGKTTLPWPQQGFYLSEHIGQIRQQEPLVHSNIAYLTEFLSERYGGPTLCVCATKSSTRRVAAAVAERFKENEPLDRRISTIIERIKSGYPFMTGMVDLLKRGVVFHNSTVPHELRIMIEDAAKERLFNVVVATTTLAEGVDLPFRFTIIVDWLLGWEGFNQVPISKLLFRNVAGRCGRAGEFTEGDTIIFDNPVGEAKYTFPTVRSKYQKDIFLSESPGMLKSGIAQVVSSTSSDRETSHAMLSSQFMAAIPENPNADDLAQAFYDHSYIGQQEELSSEVKSVLRGITSSLLDESKVALAVAASPLHLTPLGEAANNSGFSPDSCRRIIEFLRSDPTQVDDISLICTLLRRFANIPEQNSYYLTRIVGGSSIRLSVKNEDLERVTRSWIRGESEIKIFASLPTVMRSKRSPRISEWLHGSNKESTWNTDFDKFAEFISSVYQMYLPWLLRACGSLSVLFKDEWLFWVNWGELAEKLEFGVDSTWAVNAIREGSVFKREVLAEVGRRWPFVFEDPEDPLGLTHLSVPEEREQIDNIFRGLIAESDQTLIGDYLNLRLWLIERAGLRLSSL